MRYPVDNFESQWNTTAGYSFGNKTNYGFHEADDLNLNGGGNNDLGQPLYAITDGVISSVHEHTGQNTFGKHLHLSFKVGDKEYWAHYAHCNEIFVTIGQSVTEGQKIATVGNTGTVYAHCHFAIKNQPTGVDGIAKTTEDLKKWESPIAFIKSHMGNSNQQSVIDELRAARDANWNLYQGEIEKNAKLQEDLNKTTKDLKSTEDKLGVCLTTAKELNDEDKDTAKQLIACQTAQKPLEDAILGLKKELEVSEVTEIVPAIQKLKKSKVVQAPKPKTFLDKLIFLFG